MADLKTFSKDFTFKAPPNGWANEDLNTSCIMRIADSLETIALSKTELEAEVKKWKDNYDYMRARRDVLYEDVKTLRRSRNTYKGLYLKTKNAKTLR